MAQDTPNTGETVTPGNVSNDVSSTVRATDNNTQAEVERLKREAEQARMRANQLQNELDEKRKQDDEVRRKQLEEQEQYKSLYEQTNSQLEELKNSQADSERRSILAEKTNEVLKDYPTSVANIAKAAGVSLTDDSETALELLKSKLDTFQEQVGGKSSTPNNPRNTVEEVVDRRSLTTRGADGVSPMALAGARGDESVIGKYISELPAIKKMKQQAKEY